MAAVAVAGVVALRPDGGPEAVSPGHVGPIQSSVMPSELPKPTGTIAQREQQLLDTLKPYLPAGSRIVCQDVGGTQSGDCSTLMVSSPTGTSYAQWAPGLDSYQGAPADAKYCHDHKATAAIPLVSGPVVVLTGTVQVTSTDCEAQVNALPETLTEPTALTFHEAAYEFVPPGIAPACSMELFELVREMPVEAGRPDCRLPCPVGLRSERSGAEPAAVRDLAASPNFGDVREQVAGLSLEAAQAVDQHAAHHVARALRPRCAGRNPTSTRASPGPAP